MDRMGLSRYRQKKVQARALSPETASLNRGKGAN